MPFQAGDPFNPYRMFTGIFVPEGLASSPEVSAGAKLTWARLARYAGSNGECYPTMKVLGAEIGVGERQAQNYVGELERAKLLRRVSRYSGGAQTSNSFEFLWHELFETGGERSFGGRGEGSFTPGVKDRSPKESQTKESHGEERKRPRLPRRESQKPRFTPGQGAECCREYPALREALSDYMQESGESKRIPTARVVVDIMDAAGTPTESEVIDCLRYLREERGLAPGTRLGPRYFSWFPPVVAEYFQQRTHRSLPAPAKGWGEDEHPSGLSNRAFAAMTDAIEIEGMNPS